MKTFQNSGGNYGFGIGGNGIDFGGAAGIAFDDGGNMFVSDAINHVIRRVQVTMAPQLSYAAPAIVAGQSGSYGSDDNATGTSATFNVPKGLAFRLSATRTIFIADTQTRLMRRMSVIAPYTVDKPAGAFAAALPVADNPQSLVFTDPNTLYVADNTWDIHKYTSSDNGVSWTSTAVFRIHNVNSANGLANIGGDLYFTIDNEVRKLSAATLAGIGNIDATGTTVIAGGFSSPSGIASGLDFETGLPALYVADTNNNVIKKITTADGGMNWSAVTTVAGTSGQLGSIDGDGAAARFTSPSAIAVGPEGLYVTDNSYPNSLVRLLTYIPDVSVMGINAMPKVYDGTTACTLGGIAALLPNIPGLSLSAVSATAVFDDANVGNNKPVTVSGYSLTGPDAGHYNLIQPSGLTTDITAAPLDIAGIDTTVIYNGDHHTNTFTADGLVAGTPDDVASVDGLAAATNAGTYNDNLHNAAGTGLTNYDITYTNGRLVIEKATPSLTVQDLEVSSGVPVTAGLVSAEVAQFGLADGRIHTIKGAITYMPPLESLVTPGIHDVTATFTPANVAGDPTHQDGTNFSPVSKMFKVTINAPSSSPEVTKSESHVSAAAEAASGNVSEAASSVEMSGSESSGSETGGEGNAAEGNSEGSDNETSGDDLQTNRSTSEAQYFRFGLSPQRIKMGIRGMNKGALSDYDHNAGNYAPMLKALESALSSTQAMANIEGTGMSVWASGVYAQGRNKMLYSNPESSDKHYGIMMGTHYYHKPTRQLFGIAFDVGVGGSRANQDHKLHNAYKSAQATFYYGYGITKNWRVDLQLAHMVVRSDNHRPYGNDLIATSRSRSTVTSGLVETGYKFQPTKSLHLKPTVGFRISHARQNAFKESNAGADNMHFRAASMTEVAFKTGLKFSIFAKKDDVITYGLYPEINFTRYLRPGRMRQRAGLVNSNTVTLIESGTPGRNLASFTIGAGMTNSEKHSKYQIACTANFQRYRRSQEVMIKGSWEF